MASRPRGYGLTGEVNRKILNKYSVEQEQEARLWIEAVLDEPLKEGADSSVPLGLDEFQKALKDGVILCKLMNKIKPDSPIKIKYSQAPFVQMENTGKFIDACVSINIMKTDLFQTSDLYDKTNMVNVVNAIFALGRKATKIGFDGPILGPKESDSNPRNFSEETLKAGQTVIGLQMGSNKGASQSGMSFGRTRHIDGYNGSH